ncbi:MAG: phosphatase PAP2 family protein [Gammaproteobacteria bacterium]
MSVYLKTLNQQIAFTAGILIVVVILFDVSGVDVLVQDYFYNFNTHHWIIDRNNQVLKFIFYSGIKKLFILFVLLILVALLFLRKHKMIKQYKCGLLVVCISTITVPLIVGGLKSVTNVPCPKYITHYAGSYPYVTVLGSYPDNFQQKESMECYPAGHASGGFSLLALLFLFRRRKSKIIALVSVLVLGWTIGLYKMLIGDHFLSHTVVSMVLAWLIILVIAKVIYKSNEPVMLRESG